jgi:hypothetical protein
VTTPLGIRLGHGGDKRAGNDARRGQGSQSLLHDDLLQERSATAERANEANGQLASQDIN